MTSFSRYLSCLCLCAVLAAFAAVPLAAQEGEAPAGDTAGEAMLAAMMPGDEHQMLASMAGTWTITMKIWMDPSGEPQTATGTAVRSMIFDGRVLEERVSSEMMGMAFEGLGHTGYDNVTGEWWGTWMDNVGTGIILLKGTVDESTHTSTWEGEMSDPMAGGKTPMKMVVRHEGADKEVAEFYGPSPGGGEMVRTMEMTYERLE